MSRKKLYAAVAGVVVLVAALTLGLVFGLSGGEKQNTESTQAIQASVPAAEGTNEGIQVHGHWTIDVMNPDGTLASHNEFDNELYGKAELTRVLSGNTTVGIWGIQLDRQNSSELKPFTNQQGMRVAGYIMESRVVCPNYPNYFKTLSKDLDPTNIEHILLKGTAVAAFDGEIDMVRTQLSECLATTSPVSCTSEPTGTITLKYITPVTVVAGQQILVEVEISFQ